MYRSIDKNISENLNHLEGMNILETKFIFWKDELKNIAKQCILLAQNVDIFSRHVNAVEKHATFPGADSVDLHTMMVELSCGIDQPQSQQEETHAAPPTVHNCKVPISDQQECSALRLQQQDELRDTPLTHQSEHVQKEQTNKPETTSTSEPRNLTTSPDTSLQLNCLSHKIIKVESSVLPPQQQEEKPEQTQEQQMNEPETSPSESDENFILTTSVAQTSDILPRREIKKKFSDLPPQQLEKTPEQSQEQHINKPKTSSSEPGAPQSEHIPEQLTSRQPDCLSPGPYQDDQDIKPHIMIESLSMNSDCHNKSTSIYFQLQTSNASMQPDNPSSGTNRVVSSTLKQKNYQCDKCDRQFKSKSARTQHKDWKHSGRSHKCHKCGKQYLTEKILNKHIERHLSTNKPYKCEICEKAYCHISDFNRHMKIHYKAGESFQCPECKKSFSRTDQFDRHVLLHKRKAQKTLNILERIS